MVITECTFPFLKKSEGIVERDLEIKDWKKGVGGMWTLRCSSYKSRKWWDTLFMLWNNRGSILFNVTIRRYDNRGIQLTSIIEVMQREGERRRV